MNDTEIGALRQKLSGPHAPASRARGRIFWRAARSRSRDFACYLNQLRHETSGRHDVLTVRNSMSRLISAAFGKGSGRARGTLKTQTGGLENPDGRSGRAQAELGAEECTRRRRSSHIDALLTVPITASCWGGVVDKAGATMSETCQ